MKRIERIFAGLIRVAPPHPRHLRSISPLGWKTKWLCLFTGAVVTLLLLAASAVAQVPTPIPSRTPAPPEPPNTATTKRGAITGQVTTDDGQPLVGIGVTAMHAVAGSGETWRSAATDEEGKFKIDDLLMGPYRLGYGANGYISPQPDAWKQVYRPGDFVTARLVKGGVITGKVVGSDGQPLVGATVVAQRVRDSEGRVSAPAVGLHDAMSDDRGVYRIYGLGAGSYLVSVNGGYGMSFNDQIKEVPIYHPSSTRDTATDVAVQPGLVAQGIDIRHRSERGYALSGAFSGLVKADGYVTVQLTQAATGALISSDFNSQPVHKNSFAFYGVGEGEYELRARWQSANPQRGELGAASDKRKVVVKGGDVTGMELKLLALASMTGTIVLEAGEKNECPNTRPGAFDEVRLQALREEALALGEEEALSEGRAFSFPDLSPGRYRLLTQLPSDHWYVKALTLPAAVKTPAAKPTDAARTGVSLQSGEQVAGLTLTLAEGAAGLRGQVTGKGLPSRVRVFLVPAEKDAADAVLRYYEVVTRDGSFTFTNLAPGKYWLHTRAVPDDEADEKPAKPVAWDATARGKLRTDAEAANQVVELTPCQRAKDVVLKLAK